MSWWKSIGNIATKLIVANLDPKGWLTRSDQIKGGLHHYPYLKAESSDPTKWDDANDIPVFSGDNPVDPDYLPPRRTAPGMLDLHPERMYKGMKATIEGHFPLDGSGVRIDESGLTDQQKADQFVFPAEYRLVKIPAESDWPLSTNPEDANYFLYDGQNGYWKLEAQLDYEGATEFQYSIAYTEGGAPPWDETDKYNFQDAIDWEPNWESTKKAKHEYYRKKIGWSGWSRPYPLSVKNTDYVANRFIRSATQPALPEMYDENFNRNNFPAGWVDSSAETSGTNPLYFIEALFSEFSQIKEPWRGPYQVIEQVNYTVYSKTGENNPNNIVGRDTMLVYGDANSDALEAAGWVSFEGAENYNKDEYIYMAYREDDGTTHDYTSWKIIKIANEAGIDTLTVYRAFPFPTDHVVSEAAKPSTGDYIKAGWSAEKPEESENTVIFYITAKLTDSGKLIGQWSSAKKITNSNTYTDLVKLPYGDAFRFKEGASGDPVNLFIRLEAEIYFGGKAGEKLWTRSPRNIDYFWYKVFDNNQLVTLAGVFHNGEEYPAALVDNSVGADTIRLTDTSRVLEIKHTEVTGDAIIACVQRVHHDDTGSNYTDFVERIRLQDIADAIDINSLSLQIIPTIIFDDGAGNLSTSSIILRAIWSNLVPDKVRYSYSYDNANWTTITTDNTPGSGENEHSMDTTTLFGVGGHWENQSKVFYRTELLDASDNVLLSAKNDLSTIVAGTGEDSVAIDAERLSYNLITNLDGSPQAGEIGSLGTPGKAATKIRLWDGLTEKVLAADFTVALDTSPYSGGITEAQVINQDDNHQIYITGWNNAQTSGSVKFKVTYGARVFFRTLEIKAIVDEPGAVIPVISSTGNRYAFTIADESDITLSAKLYHKSQDDTQEISSGVTYQWKKNGANISGQTSASLTVTKPSTNQYDHYSCRMTYNGRVFEDGVTIQDQIDGRTQYLYNTSVSEPAKPNQNYDQYTELTAWKTVNPGGDSVWMSQKGASDAATEWSDPVQIVKKGDKGDVYLSIPMWVESATKPVLSPNNQATVAQMKVAGWVFKGNFDGDVQVWKTERLFNGNGITFNANHEPSTDPLAGSYWSDPVKEGSVDGADSTVPGPAGFSAVLRRFGSNIQHQRSSTPAPETWENLFALSDIKGDIGQPGWSPQFAAVAYGQRIILQVVNWYNPVSGATGKPTTGLYVGATGLTTIINNAVDISAGAGDYWDGNPAFINTTNSGRYVKLTFRKSKAGIVYYHGSWGAQGGSAMWFVDTLGTRFRPLPTSGDAEEHMGYMFVPLNGGRRHNNNIKTFDSDGWNPSRGNNTSWNYINMIDNGSEYIGYVNELGRLVIYVQQANVYVSGSYVAHDAPGFYDL